MTSEQIEEMDDQEKRKELERAYQNCLEKARGFSSVSFPAISCKMMGCPLDVGLEIAIKVFEEFVRTETRITTRLRDIRLCCYEGAEYEIATSTLHRLFHK